MPALYFASAIFGRYVAAPVRKTAPAPTCPALSVGTLLIVVTSLSMYVLSIAQR